MPCGPQEKAIGVRVLKEVEELAVSKLEASQQSASDASCQAAKQFLHEAPYEQVLPCPCPTWCLAYPFTPVHPFTPVIGAGMFFCSNLCHTNQHLQRCMRVNNYSQSLFIDI